MSIDYNSLLKNFQSVIVSYQDVSAIYTKLFSQGQLQKLTELLTEIYDEEHFFTLTELQKFCKDNQQKEDDFVAEQYELNSNIFRRNLTLITQNLVEEIGRKFLEKFRIEFSSPETPEENSVEQQQQQQHRVEQPYAELTLEKSNYKSNMPEIREENEPIAATPTNKVISKLLEPEEQDSYSNNGSRIYESNNAEGVQRLQPQQEGKTEKNSPVQVLKQSQEVNNAKAVQKNTPISSARDGGYKHIPSSYIKSEVSTSNLSEHNRVEQPGQRSNDFANYKAGQEKNSVSPLRKQERQNHHWSSPDRVAAIARTPRSTNNGGPFSSDSVERRNNSMLANSFSKWSLSNGRPDPSILDSEFSYGQGTSFTKSPKKFHHDISKVPGPGDYEVEESTQIKNIQHSFIKSAKVPTYFKKSDVPGAIYYPVKHFLSK